MSGRALRAAFPRTLPLMAGYLFLGLAWGILLRDKGFGVEWAIMISGLVYAGSMQFVLVGLLTTAFSPITTLFMTLMVNARHLFYGLSMLGSYSKCHKWKPYLIFSLTDETYSLVCDGHVPADVEPEAYYLAVSALDQLYWVMGSVLGVLLGRFICGFLCPFGWFQELLHKIPTKKLSTKKLKPLTYLKYAVLLVMVFLLPAFLVNDVGMGNPFFCKYLCPQGVLEGAIPLSLANSGIRAALGKLFTWKFSILLSVIALSVLFYRPFCKWLCPLGAFYALFNRVSLFQMKVDKNKCVSCGKCARACKMDVDVTKTPNHAECIRCGMCIRACPTNAVCFRYGFGDGKDKAAETPRKTQNNKEEQNI